MNSSRELSYVHNFIDQKGGNLMFTVLRLALAVMLADTIVTLEDLSVYKKATRIYGILIRVVIAILIREVFR